MSVIMPAGDKRFDWVPKDPTDKKMTKTASTGEEEIVEASDSNEALYNAAKEVVQAREAEDAEIGGDVGGLGGGLGGDIGGDIGGIDNEVSEIGGDIGGDIGGGIGGIGDEVSEVSEGGDPVEQAVEKLDEAVEEIKEAVGVDGESDSLDEIEVDIEVDGPEEGPDEPEVPSEDDLVVESTPEVEGCTAATDKEEKDGEKDKEDDTVEAKSDEKEEKDGEKEDNIEVEATDGEKCEKCDCEKCECPKEASAEGETELIMDRSASADEFCKYAKISSANRNKIKDYWKNMLGYPADYVELMTKDWE